MFKLNRTIEPTWTEENKPPYLIPTGTVYARGPYTSILTDRGIENRLLDSLVYALPDGTIIAGGFMTAVLGENKDAKDIDLFFKSEEAFKKAFDILLDPQGGDFEESEGWAVMGYEPDKIATDAIDSKGSIANLRFVKFTHPHRPPIQLIKLFWYESAEQVIDSFDLTIAQFALDVEKGDLVYNPLSVFDLVRKRIVLHRMQFPASTLRRVIKYAHKGYYACPGSLIKIAEECAKNSGNENQIVYVD